VVEVSRRVTMPTQAAFIIDVQRGSGDPLWQHLLCMCAWSSKEYSNEIIACDLNQPRLLDQRWWLW